MEIFAPEFSKFWVHAQDSHEPASRDDRRDDEARRQQQALEELNERVNAARCIV